MQPADFSEINRKYLVPVESGFWAYVPPSLPDKISLDSETWCLSTEAVHAVGLLGGIGRQIANPHLLIRPFIRREAALSSQIEGTQSDYRDLALFEADAPGSAAFDAQEVYNYVEALNAGLTRMRDLPISKRLIREMHEKLMVGVRGENLMPGRLRSLQNWIGPAGASKHEARYVPPPVPQMHRCLDEMEAWLHAPHPIPPLIQIAMAHYQFEAIHPFVDGNGRIGRLLIALLLCKTGLLPSPLLYLSAYFAKHRQAYYDHLLAVTTHAEWEAWTRFVLRGVIEQAHDAMARARRLQDVLAELRATVQDGRGAGNLLRVVDLLFETPATSAPRVQAQIDVTPRTAYRIIDRLVETGMLQEVAGSSHPKVYVAKAVIDAVTEPVEPAPPTTPLMTLA